MEKSLVYLLKAAKLDQKHCGVFLYLGRYYKEQGKLTTARKCFEQVLRINPCSDEAGAFLSDVYRELELFVSVSQLTKLAISYREHFN